MIFQRNRTRAESPTNHRPAFGLTLHLLMFGSGALALIYEILWMRRFTALFGATAPAAAATLAAVFLGLTAGNLVIGARAARIRRPLRAYGLLEIGAAIGALLVEPWLLLYDRFYPSLYTGLSGSVAGFAAVKTLLAMLALFLPTLFMGGTVPLLGHAFDANRRRLGISAGGLYAANTFGAAVGALSVPFALLPAFGATAAYTFCVAGSVLIGALAWWLDPGPSPDASNSPRMAAPTALRKAGSGEKTLPVWMLAGLAALSGLLTFVLQVGWGKMFAQVHENSIYSFAVVVAVFLVGLAGGATLARALLRRGKTATRLFGAAWLAAGFAVFVSPHVFYSLTGGLAYVRGDGGWPSYGVRLLWIAVPTVFMPVLLAGMVFPLLMELAGRASERSSGRILGWLLALNAAGSILGALLAAFVLPRCLGQWVTIAFTGLIMMALGALAFSSTDWRLTPRRFAVWALVGACLWLLAPAKIPRVRVQQSKGEKLISLKEGSHGIVAVLEQNGARRIKLDNFYVLGGTASTGDERLQGHLPLLLHPAPRGVAFLGLGTGITAGAALLHPAVQITVMEIVPEVIEAARDYFADANLGIVTSPKVEIVVEDARNYLRGSRRQFDVIVGDLVVPWRRGEAALYTLEHFATVRRSLARGGLFCQWLPMFQLSEEEFGIVVATFLDVFPRATLWRGDFAPGQPALALVGHAEDDARLDPEVIDRRVGTLPADATNPHLVHPAGLWLYLVGPLDPKEERFARARRNCEGKPWLEILGPLHHAGSSRGDVPLFVGRRLETFLDELRSRPLAGSLLAQLDSRRQQWRDAGAALGTVSILTAEGNHREADALLRQTVSTLPPEIRNAFDGAMPSPPTSAP